MSEFAVLLDHALHSRAQAHIVNQDLRADAYNMALCGKESNWFYNLTKPYPPLCFRCQVLAAAEGIVYDIREVSFANVLSIGAASVDVVAKNMSSLAEELAKTSVTISDLVSGFGKLWKV